MKSEWFVLDRLVLLDTNVLLDYLSVTRKRHADAVLLLEQIFGSADKRPALVASTLKDAYYILRRHYGSEEVVRQRLRDIRDLFVIVGLSTDIIDRAFASEEPDFEDALVLMSAEAVRAWAIVTRGRTAFACASVPVYDPHDCVQALMS